MSGHDSQIRFRAWVRRAGHPPGRSTSDPKSGCYERESAGPSTPHSGPPRGEGNCGVPTGASVRPSEGGRGARGWGDRGGGEGSRLARNSRALGTLNTGTPREPPKRLLRGRRGTLLAPCCVHSTALGLAASSLRICSCDGRESLESERESRVKNTEIAVTNKKRMGT